MPLEGWFWLALDITLIAMFIRQYRLATKELTLPDGMPTKGDQADGK